MNAAVPAMENMQDARRRWLILATVAIAQLMIVLDLTIVNVALPSAQRSLHFATVDRQWVATAYALTTHCSAVTPACSVDWTLPSATLTTVLSRNVRNSTTMSTASATARPPGRAGVIRLAYAILDMTRPSSVRSAPRAAGRCRLPTA